MGPDSSETQDFDDELYLFRQRMQKQVVQVLNRFLSFMASFQKAKAHNTLAMMLDLRFKGLRLIIQYVDKERTLHIASECDHQVLFPLLICAYKYLNPSDVNVGVPNFASQNIEPISLYDLIKIDEEMALSVVKKQLNHFRIKKIMKECKAP
jgi:hypothetical protein